MTLQDKSILRMTPEELQERKHAIEDTVRLLTRDPADTYTEYIEKIARSGNAVAVSVKTADLRHNMARAGADGLDSLARRYGKALEMLTARGGNGNE